MKAKYVRPGNLRSIAHALTMNKEYTVIREEHGFYRVTNDLGQPETYCKTRFDVVPEPPAVPEAASKKTFQEIARDIGDTVAAKNVAYGDSFIRTASVLKEHYPDGVKPKQYTDMLALVRIFDKTMRIANQKNAFGESPYRDIAGYGVLGAHKDQT